MTDQIVSRAQIRQRGYAAFANDVARADHNMNWGSPAVVDWQAGWDQAHTEALGSLFSTQAGRISPCA